MSEPLKLPLVGPDPLTPEWFAKRSEIIGSSEVAAACGMDDSYRTPLHVYREKLGLEAPFEGNEHTRRGRRYEPLIAEDFTEATGRALQKYPCPMYIHPDHPFVAATPDGIVSATEGLEIKCPTPHMRKFYGDEGSDDVPQQYLMQAQQQMAVMGWEVVYVTVKFEIHLAPVIYRVNRNDALIDLMIQAELELMERIRNQDPPEINWSHPSAPRLVREMYASVNDTRVLISDEGFNNWVKAEEMAAQIKQLEADRELLRAKVFAEMAENGIGVLGDGRIVKKIHIRETVVPAHTKAAYTYLRACKDK